MLIIFRLNCVFRPFRYRFLQVLRFSGPVTILRLLCLHPICVQGLCVRVIPVPTNVLVRRSVLCVLRDRVAFRVGGFRDNYAVCGRGRLLRLFPFATRMRFEAKSYSLLLRRRFVSKELRREAGVLARFFLCVVVRYEGCLREIRLSKRFPGVGVFDGRIKVHFCRYLKCMSKQRTFRVSVLIR